jgi:DNA mismatch repair protein MutL
MAGRIRVLDDALADQIAAGEVVERPASVIKELLENAVDAGATRIAVEIEGGGCARMRVVDDGIGMSAVDAALSVRRHATSKLRNVADLEAIATLGFRGEALPSIASVSRFSLLTRERDAVVGTQVNVEGGGAAQVLDAGCAPGTTIEVRDLFWNVPARLKFLKSRPTESGHIAAVCMRVALANPELAISLTNEGRPMRHYLRASSFIERATSVFSGETLVSIEAAQGEVRITAGLGPPERARSGASGLHLLVNGRPVRDASLARAVAYAYGSVLPPGRYPVGALHLRVPPEWVDVNVHPQKLEVRFQDSRMVFDAVTRLLARRLGTSAWGGPARRGASYWEERLRPAIGSHADSTAESHEPSSEASPQADPWGLGPLQVNEAVMLTPQTRSAAAASDAFHSTVTVPKAQAQQALPGRGFFGSLRVLGQVRHMLLICEGNDALYVIDQHAADERVRFDRLRRAFAARNVETQRLLFPERMQCTDLEAALVEGHGPALSTVGLECNLVGPTTVAIHSVPALLARAAPERLLRDMLAELERAGGRSFSAAVDRAIATMACHGAIRAGDPLPPEQAEALLRNLDDVSDFAGHCPHGRPVVHAIPLDELERKLGR